MQLIKKIVLDYLNSYFLIMLVTKCVAKIICTGNIIKLYLGKIKKIEKIIKLDNRQNPIIPFSNLLFLQNVNNPKKDKDDIIKIGII